MLDKLDSMELTEWRAHYLLEAEEQKVANLAAEARVKVRRVPRR